jgi:hypothetical protein
MKRLRLLEEQLPQVALLRKPKLGLGNEWQSRHTRPAETEAAVMLTSEILVRWMRTHCDQGYHQNYRQCCRCYHQLDLLLLLMLPGGSTEKPQPP